MRIFCLSFTSFLEKLRWAPLLFFRLVLAYGFFQPALMKLNNISTVSQYFGSMGVPFPLLVTYLTTGAETLGFILLPLGLFTRLISIPLMSVMIGAITLVHLRHGFSAAQNGFEIPLYYLLMLFALFVLGPGTLSLDALIKRCMENKAR